MTIVTLKAAVCRNAYQENEPVHRDSKCSVRRDMGGSVSDGFRADPLKRDVWDKAGDGGGRRSDGSGCGDGRKMRNRGLDWTRLESLLL